VCRTRKISPGPAGLHQAAHHNQGLGGSGNGGTEYLRYAEMIGDEISMLGVPEQVLWVGQKLVLHRSGLL
jgi:hypothetical protein